MAVVNGTALEVAIKALYGEAGFHAVDHAYSVLDAYERKVRDDMAADSERMYHQGFDDGYECGHNIALGGPQPDDGTLYTASTDEAFEDILGLSTPDVIYLPDRSGEAEVG